MLKIALCQMPVKADKQENLNQAAIMLQEASVGGAQLVVLPEMFNCPYDIHCFRDYAEKIPSGETTNYLANLARAHSLFLVGGSIRFALLKSVKKYSVMIHPFNKSYMG